MAVSLTIEGVEMITDSPGAGLLRETLRVDDVLQARASCSFGLLAPPVVPVVEDTVQLTIDGVAVFGGIITRVEAEDWGDRETLAYRVTCSDWMAVADGFLLNDISPAGSLKSILQWITTRLAAYGFTVDPAQANGPDFPSQAWPFQTQTNAINNLTAAADGWTWRISPAKVLRAYPGGAVPGGLEPDARRPRRGDPRERPATARPRSSGLRLGGTGSPTTITWTTPGNGTRVYHPPYTVTVGPTVVFVDEVELPVFPVPGDGWRWDQTAGNLYQDATDPVLDGTHTLVMTFDVGWPAYAVANIPGARYERAIVVPAPNVFDPAVAQAARRGRARQTRDLP